MAIHYAPFLSHFPSPDFFLSFFFLKKKAARLVRHQGVDNNCGCEREREKERETRDAFKLTRRKKKKLLC